MTIEKQNRINQRSSITRWFWRDVLGSLAVVWENLREWKAKRGWKRRMRKAAELEANKNWLEGCWALKEYRREG